ncbi:ImmA/IrrE family metallo-endopeptidase [Mesorhizobium australicum]
MRYEAMPENISGKIELDWLDEPVITVNKTHPRSRQRFTIAHEIAHFVLHRDLIGDGIIDNALYRDDRIGDARERQANRYAASLLMPMSLVKKAWRDGIRSAPGLASAFGVSPAVADIRWRELGCVLWQDAEEELPF